jgi:hypothetical protein
MGGDPASSVAAEAGQAEAGAERQTCAPLRISWTRRMGWRFIRQSSAVAKNDVFRLTKAQRLGDDQIAKSIFPGTCRT